MASEARARDVKDHLPMPTPTLERLSDRELLALILGPSPRRTAASADQLLEFAGGISELSRLGTDLVAERTGLGRTRALRLAAAFELGRRGLTARRLPRRLATREDVATWAEPRLVGLDHEEVWLLSVDGRNRLRTARCIARGGLHGCALSTHDVLRPALRDGASAIVLVHNHPSGDTTPSDEDIQMTRAVARACHAVGLHLLDHVIVAQGGACSLGELGVLDTDRYR